MSGGTIIVGQHSTLSSFTSKTCGQIIGAIANCFAAIGLAIGLLIFAANFYGPAEILLERLLVW